MGAVPLPGMGMNPNMMPQYGYGMSPYAMPQQFMYGGAPLGGGGGGGGGGFPGTPWHGAGYTAPGYDPRAYGHAAQMRDMEAQMAAMGMGGMGFEEEERDPVTGARKSRNVSRSRVRGKDETGVDTRFMVGKSCVFLIVFFVCFLFVDGFFFGGLCRWTCA